MNLNTIYIYIYIYPCLGRQGQQTTLGDVVGWVRELYANLSTLLTFTKEMEWSLLDGRVEHSRERLMWRLRSIVFFFFKLKKYFFIFLLKFFCIALHMFDASVQGRNHYSNPRHNYAGAIEGRRHTDTCKSS
jgi:hypothetical protein